MSNSIVSNGCEYTAQGQYKCPVKAEETFREHMTESDGHDIKEQQQSRKLCCDVVNKLMENNGPGMDENNNPTFAENKISPYHPSNMMCTEQNVYNTCSVNKSIYMETLANTMLKLEQGQFATPSPGHSLHPMQVRANTLMDELGCTIHEAVEILDAFAPSEGVCYGCLRIEESEPDAQGNKVFRDVCGQGRINCNTLSQSMINAHTATSAAGAAPATEDSKTVN